MVNKDDKQNWTSATLFPIVDPAIYKRPLSDVEIKGEKRRQKARRKEEKRKERAMRKNPHKGSWRDFLTIDLLSKTWEGMLIYTLPGIISFFVLLFRVNYTSWQSVLDTTLKSFTWVLSLIFLIPFCAWAINYWVKWIRAYIFIVKIPTFSRVIVKKGVPGQGKTSSMYYEAVLAAKINWRRLRREYAVLRFKKSIFKTLSPKDEAHWKEVSESYDFCINSPCVPLLWTNMPLMVDGRFSNQLRLQHVQGTLRLPYLSVLVMDEASRFLDEGKSMQHNDNKDWDVSNFFAFIRHFIDGVAFLASQDDNIFIDVVRCALYTEIMNKQEAICKPFWVNAGISICESLIDTANIKKSKRCYTVMPVYLWLKKFWSHVGFREYNSSKRANRTGTNTIFSDAKEGKKIVGNSRNNTFIVPSVLNCKYDDRCMREYYPGFFKDLSENLQWSDLVVKEGQFPIKNTKSKFEIKLEKERIKLDVKNELKKTNVGAQA